MQRVKTTGTAVTAFLVILAMLACMLPSAFAAEPSSSTTFTFSDSGVTASGSDSGYKISGTALTINEAGTYTITGSCADGSITVKKGTTGVTLVLKDLTLTSTTTAPLSCNKGTETTLYISGTVTLNDNETDENADGYEGAAIKVKSESSSLTITGAGVLNANGNSKNGIKGAATASITVAGGTVNVKAVNNGLASDGSVVVTGGRLNVTAGNDGIKSEPDEDDADSAGTVTISGGDITLNTSGDGIQAANDVTISGGTFNITTFGGYSKARSLGSDDSAKGIKSNSSVTISGGTFTLNCADDAVHSNNTVTVTGGTFTVQTGDDAFHGDAALTVGGSSSGPDITVTTSYEGFEGAVVNLHAGSARITASDDGINAANSNYRSHAIHISGGSWYVNAGGDGLDSNGDITISGGVTEVYGAADNGNAALDFDGSCTYTGGTLLTVGMSGMAQVPSSGTYVYFGQSGMMGGMGGQPGGNMGGMGRTMFSDGSESTDTASAESVTLEAGPGGMGGQMPGQNGQNGQFPGQNGQTQTGMNQSAGTVSISAGSSIVIQDSSGNTVYSATGVKNANSVLLCDDSLTSGETYYLYVNGSHTASATASTGSGQGGMGGQTGQQPGQNQNGQTPGQPGQDQNGQTPGQPGQNQNGQTPGQPGQDQNNQPPELPGQDQNGQPPELPGQDQNGQPPELPEQSDETEPAFSDVPQGSWYAPAVDYVQEKGTMNGYGNGAFAPKANLTRAQAAQLLYNLGGNGEKADSGTFSDVPEGKWYTDAVNWANGKGLVQGSGGAFRPDDEISRQELVTILYRYAEEQGADMRASADLGGFRDAAQISDWAQDAMRWAVGSGIVQGSGNNCLNPQGTATRAEIAQILMNYTQRFA